MFPDFEGSSVDRIKQIKTPKEMSVLLAEDIGFHLGDGHMSMESNGWGTKYRFSYAGHWIDDKDYFLNILAPRKKELFNVELSFRKQKRSQGIEARFSSKKVLMFYKALGIPVGKKTNVNIPKCICEANELVKCAFLRGLFDSDGSLSLKNRPNGYYSVIGFATASAPLMLDVQQILSELEFCFTTYKKSPFDKRCDKVINTYALDLNGKKQLDKWMKLIGFSNKKHLEKYQRYLQSKI